VRQPLDVPVVRTAVGALFGDRNQVAVVAGALAAVPVLLIRAEARFEQQPVRRRVRPSHLFEAAVGPLLPARAAGYRTGFRSTGSRPVDAADLRTIAEAEHAR